MPHFSMTVPVRWSDCDANGHVRNTAYSEYAVDVRVGFLASQGWTYDDFVKHHIGPVIIREEIDYVRELRMGDEVTVDVTWVGASNDGARFKFLHEFTRRRDGKPCARILILGGWMDLAQRRLAPPPARLAEVMARFERGPSWEVLPDAGAKKA